MLRICVVCVFCRDQLGCESGVQLSFKNIFRYYSSKLEGSFSAVAKPILQVILMYEDIHFENYFVTFAPLKIQKM